MVNNALISDNADCLSRWIGLIREINNYLLSSKVSRSRCYRVSPLSSDEEDKLMEGETYRFCNYVVMVNKSKSEAENLLFFQQMPKAIRWEFEIPEGCYHTCAIDQISKFWGEGAMILAPYSAVKILQKYTENGKVYIKAAVYYRDSVLVKGASTVEGASTIVG